MSNFDSILKKGKNAVSENNEDFNWREQITKALLALQTLNEMYENSNRQNIAITAASCNGCGIKTFIITTPELSNDKKLYRFFLGDWEPIGDLEYKCPKCKGK